MSARSANSSDCEFWQRGRGFAKCQRVKMPIPQHLKMYFLHLWGYEINRSGDSLPAVLEVPTGNGKSFIGAFHMLFGLIGNQDAAPWLCHADHFPDSFGSVIEEVDAPDVKHDIETVVGKGQIFGISEKQIRIHLPAAQVGLAICQHFRREIE